MGLVVEGSVTRTARWLARIPLWLLAGAAAMAWAASIEYAHLDSRFSLDLRVYRAASKSLMGGHNPYQLDFTDYHLPFTYPPPALLAFRPISLGSVHVVEALWWLINALAVVAILYRGVRSTLELPRHQTICIALVFAPVLSLVFEPLRTNTTYGQINVVLLLLVVFDITKSRWRIGGFLVGVAAAIKLTPLVYLLYFAVKKEWRSLSRGAAAFAGIGAVAFIVLPSESRTFWFHQLFDPGRTGTVGSRRNQSWYGMVHRWPFPNGSAVVTWALLSLVTVGGAVVLVRRLVLRRHVIDSVIALGLCTELISPISWSHHWVWIVLVPVLIVRGFRGQPFVMASMILLCLVGAIGPYAWDLHGWPGRGLDNTLVFAGALAFFTWLISEVRFRPPRSDALTDEAIPAEVGR